VFAHFPESGLFSESGVYSGVWSLSVVWRLESVVLSSQSKVFQEYGICPESRVCQESGVCPEFVLRLSKVWSLSGDYPLSEVWTVSGVRSLLSRVPSLEFVCCLEFGTQKFVRSTKYA
jgi:hypothetical protein